MNAKLSSLRPLVIAGALAFIPCVVAAASGNTPTSTSAVQFRDALLQAVRATIAAGSGQTPVQLEQALEQAVQTTFVSANVSKSVAQQGLDQARAVLVQEGLYCPLPTSGTVVSTCQAVDQALQLATAAVNGLPDEAVAALPGNQNATPPASTGGGAGGGVTHPSVQ